MVDWEGYENWNHAGKSRINLKIYYLLLNLTRVHKFFPCSITCNAISISIALKHTHTHGESRGWHTRIQSDMDTHRATTVEKNVPHCHRTQNHFIRPAYAELCEAFFYRSPTSSADSFPSPAQYSHCSAHIPFSSVVCYSLCHSRFEMSTK